MKTWFRRQCNHGDCDSKHFKRGRCFDLDGNTVIMQFTLGWIEHGLSLDCCFCRRDLTGKAFQPAIVVILALNRYRMSKVGVIFYFKRASSAFTKENVLRVVPAFQTGKNNTTTKTTATVVMNSIYIGSFIHAVVTENMELDKKLLRAAKNTSLPQNRNWKLLQHSEWISFWRLTKIGMRWLMFAFKAVTSLPEG